MMIKKIQSFFLLWTLVIAGILPQLALADSNKNFLLDKISTLQTRLTTLNTSTTQNLENRVYEISANYDSMISRLGYDNKSVEYLFSLGKINSNLKWDLANELSSVSREISDAILSELNALSSIRNDLNLNYSTVWENQKNQFLVKIQLIENNYNNLNSSFPWKITSLSNKFTAQLSTYENEIKQAYTSNSSILGQLKDFDGSYDNLFALYSDFENKYTQFQNSYFAYAGDLILFSWERQRHYTQLLSEQLQKTLQANLLTNSSLTSYQTELERYAQSLLENFENNLKTTINEWYGVIYSENDINSLISRYNSVKNRYYTLDGKLKANEVVAFSGALQEVTFIQEALWDINTKITTLLWTWNTSNTYENVKIRLENQMIRFYNSAYPKNREDLSNKIQEKINIISLEAKNVLLASDAIDLRLNLLNEKIKSNFDIPSLKQQIKSFRSDIAKYKLIQSDILDKKIANIEIDLWILLVWRELQKTPYVTMSSTNIEKQLALIVDNLRKKSPQTYITKLAQIVEAIDGIDISKMNRKNQHLLLVMKQYFLNTIRDSL